jgi:large subunit ribosomal protein L19e
MELNKLRALAAKTLEVGRSRVRIMDAEKAAEAITREDVRTLYKEGGIVVLPAKGTSRGRARKLAAKKKSGRKIGPGSRKGTKKTRQGFKRQWMTHVRSQRRMLKKRRPANYRKLYRMVKGRYFKNLKHLDEYIKAQV